MFRRLLIPTLILIFALAGFTAGRALGQKDEGPPAAKPDVALNPVAATGSTFTYQGELRQDDAPYGGACDFEFVLFGTADGGSPVGDSVVLTNHAVADGRFTAHLDFGPGAFTGDARWLEVRVRCPAGTDNWETLSPRQPLTAAPYALSLRPGATISGTVDGTFDGILNVTNTGTGTGAVVNAPNGFGIIVDSANDSGIAVNVASGNGVGINAAGVDGVYVDSAGDDGIEINHADNDGLFICTTGNETTCTPSERNNGVEVGNADFYGVYVGDAGQDGVYVNAAGEDGVYVNSPTDNGVFVLSAGEDGVVASQATANGVAGSTVSNSSYGGRFINLASSGSGAGLYARGSAGSAPDIVLGANGSGLAADDGRIVSDPAYDGSDIRFYTNDNFWIDLDESGTHSGSNFTVRNSSNQTVWAVDENGNVTSSGASTTVVDTGAEGQVQLYAMQSAENWFEDFGGASLVDGEATVAVDPTFAAAVNLNENYHVYLTPLGDCALFVADKSPTSFEVQALGGATCNVDFDYRIVAKRDGYEDVRLETVEPAGAEE